MNFLAILILAATPYVSPIVDQWQNATDSMQNARSLQTAVEAYWFDNNHFPVAKSVEELQKLIEPKYIKTTPLTDAWGTPFLYRAGADGQSYTLASAGSDKKFDEKSWSAGYSTNSKDDLVYQPHDFVREWVIQRVCK